VSYVSPAKISEGEPLKNEMIPGFELLPSAEELDEPMANLTNTLKTVVGKLKADKNSWPFLEPVNLDDVPEYYDHVAFPMDLGTISDRIKDGYYSHVSAECVCAALTQP
jgi:hypothetical protein